MGELGRARGDGIELAALRPLAAQGLGALQPVGQAGDPAEPGVDVDLGPAEVGIDQHHRLAGVGDHLGKAQGHGGLAVAGLRRGEHHDMLIAGQGGHRLPVDVAHAGREVGIGRGADQVVQLADLGRIAFAPWDHPDPAAGRHALHVVGLAHQPARQFARHRGGARHQEPTDQADHAQDRPRRPGRLERRLGAGHDPQIERLGAQILARGRLLQPAEEALQDLVADLGFLLQIAQLDPAQIGIGQLSFQFLEQLAERLDPALGAVGLVLEAAHDVPDLVVQRPPGLVDLVLLGDIGRVLRAKGGPQIRDLGLEAGDLGAQLDHRGLGGDLRQREGVVLLQRRVDRLDLGAERQRVELG